MVGMAALAGAVVDVVGVALEVAVQEATRSAPARARQVGPELDTTRVLPSG